MIIIKLSVPYNSFYTLYMICSIILNDFPLFFLFFDAYLNKISLIISTATNGWVEVSFQGRKSQKCSTGSTETCATRIFLILEGKNVTTEVQYH
jgi:hypothetical protein